MKLSRKVLSRQRAGISLNAAAAEHGDEAGAGLAALLAPYLGEGESVPDLSLFQNLLSRHHAAQIRLLVRFDEAHAAEIDNDAANRRRRDRATENLYQTLTRIRKVIDATCGDGSCSETLGFGGPVTREPLAVLRKAQRVIERIDAPGFRPPVLGLPGLAADPALWRAELAGPTAELEQAVEALAADHREAETSRRNKNQALADYDLVYGRIGRLLEAMYSLAGFPDLAAKVRPSRRRAVLQGADPAPAPAPAPAGVSSPRS